MTMPSRCAGTVAVRSTRFCWPIVSSASARVLRSSTPRPALPAGTLTGIPNGVNLERFRPPAAGERDAIRRELGLPTDRPIVLFVGFFSHEKRPDLAFRAWTETFDSGPESALVLVGLTASPYYEIDSALADGIRMDADRLHCRSRLTMVERTDAIERFYRAADVLMLPSTRE